MSRTSGACLLNARGMLARGDGGDDRRRRRGAALASNRRSFIIITPLGADCVLAAPACVARVRARSRARVLACVSSRVGLRARMLIAREVRIITSGPLAGQFGAFARADLAAPLPPGYMLPFAGAVVAVGRRAFEVCRGMIWHIRIWSINN